MVEMVVVEQDLKEVVDLSGYKPVQASAGEGGKGVVAVVVLTTSCGSWW